MLNTKKRTHLKSLAHALKPVVGIGKKGFTPALTAEIDAALLAHELIKLKFQESAVDNIDSILDQLCQELNAEKVSLVGHIATIYRAHPEKPKIAFP